MSAYRSTVRHRGALIFLPMRSRESDTRTVSTSASSGIACSRHAASRGLGFGALLRTTSARRLEVGADVHGRHEGRRRAAARSTSRRSAASQAARLGPLAQASLGIDVAGARRPRGHVTRRATFARRSSRRRNLARGRARRPRPRRRRRGVTGARAPPSFFTPRPTRIELAERRDACAASRERRLVHDPTSHQGPGALVEIGVASDDEVRDREVDDRVAKELEPFVRGDTVLGGVARVGQRGLEQRARRGEADALGQ